MQQLELPTIRVLWMNHELTKWFNVVDKMEVGPPLASYRWSQQTTLRCFFGDEAVLNGIGKRHCWKCQVRIEKMNESEPSMKCRENVLSVKTVEGLCYKRSIADDLLTGYMADVIKGAWILFRLINRTEEVLCVWPCKGKSTSRANTCEAEYRRRIRWRTTS